MNLYPYFLNGQILRDLETLVIHSDVITENHRLDAFFLKIWLETDLFFLKDGSVLIEKSDSAPFISSDSGIHMRGKMNCMALH